MYSLKLLAIVGISEECCISSVLFPLVQSSIVHNCQQLSTIASILLEMPGATGFRYSGASGGESERPVTGGAGGDVRTIVASGSS